MISLKFFSILFLLLLLFDIKDKASAKFLFTVLISFFIESLFIYKSFIFLSFSSMSFWNWTNISNFSNVLISLSFILFQFMLIFDDNVLILSLISVKLSSIFFSSSSIFIFINWELFSKVIFD